MTYEPTPEQIEAALLAYWNDDGDTRDGIRAALIAAEKAAWVKTGEAPGTGGFFVNGVLVLSWSPTSACFYHHRSNRHDTKRHS